MSRKRLSTAIALGVSFAAAGCVLDGEGADGFDRPCAGKCDDTQLPAITALDGLDLEIVDSDPDSGLETFALVSGPHPDAADLLVHGDSFDVRVVGSDGAADPSHAVSTSIEFDDRGFFFADDFEAAFLPWQQLTFDVSGELDGRPVNQTFVVNRSVCGYFEGVMSCPSE